MWQPPAARGRDDGVQPDIAEHAKPAFIPDNRLGIAILRRVSW